jgi:hypothetical protein
VISPTRSSHSFTRTAALTSVLLLLVGCAPDPQPSATPTPAFASEEEAFAAAEATYREFTARLNELDTADPSTFEPLFDLSSGDFEAADREAYSAMHADGMTIQGQTIVTSFVGTLAIEPFETVTANVCLDVSDVTVTDSEGNSQVDPSRPDVYALNVTFVREHARLTIDSASRTSDVQC